MKTGKIENELDFERALITDRKLRKLSKENNKYKNIRKELRDLIEIYENENWAQNSIISDKKIKESDSAELISEKENIFIQRRKKLIKQKLKELELTQQDFGKILGHHNKSYISELMNGVSAFSLKDLVIINRLLKIELTDLIPTFLSQSDMDYISKSVEKLKNPNLKLNNDEFVLV
ncbi:MAG: helix-turn-helix domain-containing protein [Psychroflexus sp.]